MTAEKIIAADNKPQDKFTDELLSDAELDNVAGGTIKNEENPTGMGTVGKLTNTSHLLWNSGK